MSKPALGRGLGALLGGQPPVGKGDAVKLEEGNQTPVNSPSSGSAVPPQVAVDEGDRVLKLGLDRIQPGTLQPRKDFAEESLDELSRSIREQGILQPLIVRRRGDVYELIAGERRWRAARMAGLEEVPVIVREMDDPTTLEMMLIENLQREGLNPIEEADGYQQLIQMFHLTQEEVATKVGKSRAAVANVLRLLKLSSFLKEKLKENVLSVGHAKVLLSASSLGEAVQNELANRVIREGLTVRLTEELVNQVLSRKEEKGSGKEPEEGGKVERDPHLADMESQLRHYFGTKVQIKGQAEKGAIEIKFFDRADLDRILKKLGMNESS